MTFDVFTNPSDKNKLLASYDTWKSVSTEAKRQGREDLHIRIERLLVGKRGAQGVSLTFAPTDAAAIIDVAGVKR